jgi:hypothetical protein
MAEGLTTDPDVDRVAHHAVCTVTSDEIFGLNVLATIAFEIDDFRDHSGFGRREGLEPCAIAQADVRKCTGEALQDRIDPHL